MNEETNTPSTTPNPPANIDATIQAFLDHAYRIATDPTANPKEVCALGWLVLKIKECLTEAAATGKPLARGLTTETILSIEQANKIL